MTAGRWKKMWESASEFLLVFIQIIFVESSQKARILFDPR